MAVRKQISVLAAATRQPVIPRATVQNITASFTIQTIFAFTAFENIIITTAAQGVVARAARHPVYAIPTELRVVRVCAGKRDNPCRQILRRQRSVVKNNAAIAVMTLRRFAILKIIP